MIAHVKPEARGLAGAVAEQPREVYPSGDDAPQTMVVRARIESALFPGPDDLSGHVVKIDAARLDSAPLLVRVRARGRDWYAIHASTRWDANHVGWAASLAYEINPMPF